MGIQLHKGSNNEYWILWLCQQALLENAIFNDAEEQDENKPNYKDEDNNWKTLLSLYWTILIAYPWLLLWQIMFI